MAINNLIAQAGINAGRNIQNTVGNALVRRENQKRYEADQLAKEQAAMTEQNRYQTAQNRLDRGEEVAAANTQWNRTQKGISQLAQILQNTPQENHSQVWNAATKYFNNQGIDISGIDPNMVENSIKRPNAYKMLSTEEVAAAGLPAGNYQKDVNTGKVSKVGGSGVTINNGKEESKFAETMGGYLADDYKKVFDAGSAAAEQQETLNVLKNLDVQTGFGTEAKLGLGRAVAAVWGEDFAEQITGVDVTAAQAFKSIESKMVNAVLNVAKGPQTEGDAIRAKAQLASLKNTPAANQWIISYMRAINARKMEQAEFYRAYREANIDGKGVEAAWRGFKQKTPMLSATQRKDGVPLFFHQFKEDMNSLNPGITDQQIIDAWRKQEKGSK